MTTLKIGDKVVIENLEDTMRGFELGETVEISANSHSGRFQIQRVGSTYTGYGDPSSLKKVEHRKFQVGDKVKIIGTTNHFHKIGEIGEVIGADNSDSLRVLVKTLRQYVKPFDLELIERKVAPFKKGDTVIVNGNSKIRHYLREGSTANVLSARFEEKGLAAGWQATVMGEEYEQIIHEDDLKLAKEVTVADLKPGDKFYFEGPASDFEDYITPGKIYVATKYDEYEDLQFIDDDGDEIDVDRCSADITIFKVEEAPKVVEEEPAVSEAGPRFKVGDKVKVTGDTDRIIHFFSIGTEGTVTESYFNANSKESPGWRCKVRAGRTTQIIHEDHLELAQEPKATEATQQSFEIGDIVKGVEDGIYGITNHLMTQGEVIEKSEEAGTIRVKVLEHSWRDEIGATYGVLPKYFELVKKADVPVATPETKYIRMLGIGDPGYSKGDILKVTENGLSFIDNDGDVRPLSAHDFEYVSEGAVRVTRTHVVDFLSTMTDEELLDLIEEARKERE